MISETIKRIIEKRQSTINSLLEKEKEIDLWHSLPKKLLEFNDEHLNDNLWNEIINENQLNSIYDNIVENSKSLDERCSKLKIGHLKSAISRAKRTNLNIGSIGPWRQGKSLMLQKLTGLDKWILPTSADSDPCTGTTVNIIQEEFSNPNDNNNYDDVAVVYYYTFKEICNDISKYFDELGIKGVTITANSIEDFNKLCTDLLKKYNTIEDTSSEYYKMLGFYLNEESRNEYVSLLKTNDSKDNERFEMIKNVINDIDARKKYYKSVSYYSDIDQKERHYYVLATSKVEVYTSKFKINGEPIKSLQFLDTPGIGEKKLGVDKALKEALREKLDIAVILYSIRRANPQNLNDFTKILKEEVCGRQPEDWIFLLLNIWTSECGADGLRNKNINEAQIKILSSLQSPTKNKSSISLPKNHCAKIDIYEDKYVSEIKEKVDDKGKRFTCPICEGANATSDFFSRILKDIVDKIESIDKSVYADVDIEYEGIKKDYEQLQKKIHELTPKIKSYKIGHDSIIEQIETLRKNVNDYDYGYLTEKLKMDVSEYCDSKNLGKELIDVLVSNGYDSNEPTLQSLNQKMQEIINQKDDDKGEDDEEENYLKKAWGISSLLRDTFKSNLVDKDMYGNLCEFRWYADNKESLSKQIRENVMKLINTQETDKKLDDIKAEMWKIFMKAGRFKRLFKEFRNINDEEIKDEIAFQWYNKFILSISNYPNLYDAFTSFANYKLNIREQLATIVIPTIQQCLHNDRFAINNPNFTSLQATQRAFLFSLLLLEIQTKIDLKSQDELFQRTIKSIEENFIDAKTSFAGIMYQKKKSAAYGELYDFYSHNALALFADSDSLKKAELVSDWNSTVIPSK